MILIIDTVRNACVDGCSIFIEEFNFEATHLEIIPRVCFLRLDNVAQLAQANSLGKLFESGIFNALLFGQSPAYIRV